MEETLKTPYFNRHSTFNIPTVEVEGRLYSTAKVIAKYMGLNKSQFLSLVNLCEKEIHRVTANDLGASSLLALYKRHFFVKTVKGSMPLFNLGIIDVLTANLNNNVLAQAAVERNKDKMEYDYSYGPIEDQGVTPVEEKEEMVQLPLLSNDIADELLALRKNIENKNNTIANLRISLLEKDLEIRQYKDNLQYNLDKMASNVLVNIDDVQVLVTTLRRWYNSKSKGHATLNAALLNYVETQLEKHRPIKFKQYVDLVKEFHLLQVSDWVAKQTGDDELFSLY